MPAILERLIYQLKQKGKSDSAARAIAVSALQRSGNLKKGTTEATSKGTKRGKMTPSERAKDRAVKYSPKHKESDFVYNSKKNTTKLKNR